MSTRHQGARVQDYAAMLKNSSISPGQKRLKLSEHGDYKNRHHKHSSTAKSKPSGLGFADSDDEKNVREFDGSEEDIGEEGEEEMEEDGQEGS